MYQLYIVAVLLATIWFVLKFLLPKCLLERKVKDYKKLGGGLPIIGDALLFNCPQEDILNRLAAMIDNFGDSPFKFWLGPKLLLGFKHPRQVEKILVMQQFAHKDDIYDFAKIFLGDGLVSGSGPKHKMHRKIIQPMLNQQFFELWWPTFQKHADTCMNILNKAADTGSIDILTTLHNFCVDIVGESILGKTIDAQHGKSAEFLVATRRAYKLTFARMVRPWLHPEFIYKFTHHKKDQRNFLVQIHNFLQDVLTERSTRSEIGNAVPIIDQIREYVWNTESKISKEDFFSHMFTLYLASEDTLTLISSFTCLCLGMYPEYQDKAALEIRSVFGESPRPVTIADIGKLNYLDMCIKDVFRLVPIAPYILRKSPNECKIDGWRVPKDCALIIPIFNIHRDQKYWATPNHFNPDHFLPDAVKHRPVYAYLPFSAGPRGCIGKTFANVAIKLVIAEILQRFQLSAEGKFPDVSLTMDISVRARNTMQVKITKRIW